MVRAGRSGEGQLLGYRWILDPIDPNDLSRWSPLSLATTSVMLGPFPGAGSHALYVEAEDALGYRSLGIVPLAIIVPPPIQKTLAIVNDTRFQPDQLPAFPVPGYPPDSVGAPVGGWPSRAELDTFLFARGGAPWKWAPPNPVDPTKRWLSPPGIFEGYDFDTISTQVPMYSSSVPLSVLAQYSHVVWLTDAIGATGVFTPVATLGAMSRPWNENTLTAYVAMGGSVWLAGGGCATANLFPFKVSGNNTVPPLGVTKFWSTPATPGRPPELAPGRFMYDDVHWRSQIWVTGVNYPYVYRSPRAVDTKPAYTYPNGFMPDYSKLPANLRLKSPANGDALYPYYPWRNASDMFYATSVWNVEGIPGTLPFPQDPQASWNRILENFSTNPDSVDFESTLDTLMAIRGYPFQPPHEDPADTLHFYENVVMTWYHGRDNPPVLFSGFDLWSGNRQDLIQLVDFVLQDMWGLTRDTTTVRRPGAALRADKIRRGLRAASSR